MKYGGLNAGIMIFAVLSLAFLFILFQNVYLMFNSVSVETTIAYVDVSYRALQYPKDYVPSPVGIPVAAFMVGEDIHSVKTCKWCHKQGEEVTVIYSPTNPDFSAIKNLSFLGMPIFYLAVSSTFLYLTIRRKKHVMKEYAELEARIRA